MTIAVGAHRTGYANLPLHWGKAPPWLFQRMVKLARGMTLAIVEDQGPEAMLGRLSEPAWFQAFGCVLGFDWHSSGVTTTVCGAMKEGLHGLEQDTGLYVAGGKGGTSRKTPSEITQAGEALGEDLSSLVYASRMSAKVDSSAVQDGYQVYHHSFFFTAKGNWAVVQQGMNEDNGYARRYHWLGSRVASFVEEPHAAVCCDARDATLNLVAQESAQARRAIAYLATEEHPDHVLADVQRLKTLTLPHRHYVAVEDIRPEHLARTLAATYDRQPVGFEGVLAMPGVGAKTLRALSLVAELVYGMPASVRDPALYSFAHGGKDGYPYPVDRETYDGTIAYLGEALRRAKVGESDRLDALRRLEAFWRDEKRPRQGSQKGSAGERTAESDRVSGEGV